MNQAFVRCPHCGLPHELDVTVCPSTHLSIPRGGRGASVTRMQKAAVIPPGPVIPRAPLQGVGPAPRDDRPMVGRVIGDKYGVIGLIGEGGMGAVYEAEHLTIGRLVAVKVLHPKNAQSRDAVTRMHHEARVVGTIGHPNICEIYDIGRLDDGSPYLVMERLHGETLAERILRDGAVPHGDLLDVMVQVLSALVVAHEKGVIHRDLKPDNIFLSQRAGMPPIAKLLDFGISKAANEDTAVNITRTGMVMGTPYYMAPEQARGDRTLDHRVDLWAAGIILYEALSGRRPFVARNYNALLVQILTSRHRPVGEYTKGLPAGLGEAIDKALSKMREDRFQSAMEFQERLMEMRRASRSGPPAPPTQAAHLEPRFGQGRSLMSRQPASAAPEPMSALATPLLEVPDDRPTIPAREAPDAIAYAVSGLARPAVPVFDAIVIREETTSDDATVVLHRKSAAARPPIPPPLPAVADKPPSERRPPPAAEKAPMSERRPPPLPAVADKPPSDRRPPPVAAEKSPMSERRPPAAAAEKAPMSERRPPPFGVVEKPQRMEPPPLRAAAPIAVVERAPPFALPLAPFAIDEPPTNELLHLPPVEPPAADRSLPDLGEDDDPENTVVDLPLFFSDSGTIDIKEPAGRG